MKTTNFKITLFLHLLLSYIFHVINTLETFTLRLFWIFLFSSAANDVSDRDILFEIVNKFTDFGS